MSFSAKQVVGITLVVGLAVVGLAGCARIRPPENAEKIQRTMTVTAYCKCGKCCNWHRNWYFRPVIKSGPNKGKPKKVGYTACGKKARVGTIAADTSRYPFGTVMYVPGYGYGVVEDRGKDMKGDCIDLYFKKHQQAVKWGRKRLTVTVWLKR